MTNTYLSFMVCGEQFATDVGKVLEVLQTQHITVVPNAPGFIKGIINFRGDFVPVFESRVKFNLPDRDKDASFNIIVLDIARESEKFRTGVIVDHVRDVITINDNDIKPVPQMGHDLNTEFLNGIYKLNEDFILMLDVDNVFLGSELKAVGESKVEVDSNM